MNAALKRRTTWVTALDSEAESCAGFPNWESEREFVFLFHVEQFWEARFPDRRGGEDEVAGARRAETVRKLPDHS